MELAIRDWARRDRPVARRLRRVDNRRMDYMRSLFGAFCPDEDEVEARCLLAFSLFIGSPSSPPTTASAAAQTFWSGALADLLSESGELPRIRRWRSRMDEVRLMIEAALPGAEVEVVDETGTGDHLRATVAAPQFEGLSRIDQHRLVKAAVKERFDDGTIHALSMKTGA